MRRVPNGELPPLQPWGAPAAPTDAHGAYIGAPTRAAYAAPPPLPPIVLERVPAGALEPEPKPPAPRGNALSHALIALGVLLIVAATAYALLPKRVLAYEVWLGKRDIGIVADKDRLNDRIEALRASRSEQYGIDVRFATAIEYKPVYVAREFVTGVSELIAAYDALADIQVKAAAILIEGEVVAATSSSEDSKWVIDQVLAPYEEQRLRGRIERYEMIEDVRIESCMVPESIVMNKENVYHRLMVGTDEVRTAIVKEGESIHSIAAANNLSVADLKKANPRLLASDVVRPGEELNLIVPQSVLNVRYYSRVDAVIDLPFKTIVEYDDKQYITQKKVTTPGRKGIQQVVAQREFIAGVVINETIIERKIITQAEDQRVIKGTKAVAKKASSGTAPSKNANVPGFVENEVSADGFSWPASGTLSSKYGQRWNRLHAGIDIATPRGTPVYASRAGTVVLSGYNGGYGSVIYIDHGDGIATRYAHNSKLLKKKGDKVERGELIALSGNSGNSTGPHVHFEIRVGGEPVNPLLKLPSIN